MCTNIYFVLCSIELNIFKIGPVSFTGLTGNWSGGRSGSKWKMVFSWTSVNRSKIGLNRWSDWLDFFNWKIKIEKNETQLRCRLLDANLIFDRYYSKHWSLKVLICCKLWRVVGLKLPIYNNIILYIVFVSIIKEKTEKAGEREEGGGVENVSNLTLQCKTSYQRLHWFNF